jgi:hypothetical protein
VTKGNLNPKKKKKKRGKGKLSSPLVSKGMIHLLLLSLHVIDSVVVAFCLGPVRSRKRLVIRAGRVGLLLLPILSISAYTTSLLESSLWGADDSPRDDDTREEPCARRRKTNIPAVAAHISTAATPAATRMATSESPAAPELGEADFPPLGVFEVAAAAAAVVPEEAVFPVVTPAEPDTPVVWPAGLPVVPTPAAVMFGNRMKSAPRSSPPLSALEAPTANSGMPSPENSTNE